MSAYYVLPTLFPHGGPFPGKTETTVTFFHHTLSFTDVSLGRNKDMRRNEGTTKRIRNFRGKKRTEDVIRWKE